MDEQRVIEDGADLESAVYQALGAASTAWDNLEGAGVFDSERCKAIGEELLERIRSEAPQAPRLAGRVEITRTRSAEGNRHEITVDGEPFPFHMALEPIEINVHTPAPSVRISLMCEDLVVLDTIGADTPNLPVARYGEGVPLEAGRRIVNTEVHDRLAGKETPSGVPDRGPDPRSYTQAELEAMEGERFARIRKGESS